MLRQEAVRDLPPRGGRALIVGSLTALYDDWTALRYFAVVVEEAWMSELNDHEAVHLSCPDQWTPALEYASCCCDLRQIVIWGVN